MTVRFTGSIDVHRLLPERHRRLRDVAVVELHRVGRLPPEHHIELRVAEHEVVALVDQRDLDLVGDLLRQSRRQLQAAESRPEDEHPFHGRRSYAAFSSDQPSAAGMPSQNAVAASAASANRPREKSMSAGTSRQSSTVRPDARNAAR